MNHPVAQFHRQGEAHVARNACQRFKSARLFLLKAAGSLVHSVALFAVLLSASSNQAADSNPQSATSNNSVAIEALSRLKDIDLEANPAVKAAVMRVIQSARGTPEFVELVRDFKIKDQDVALLEFALAHSKESVGVEAMQLVLVNESAGLVRKALAGTNALSAVNALASANHQEVAALLEPLLTDLQRDVALRKAALLALTQQREGAEAVLKLAKEDKLPADLKLTASSELNNVRWANIKADAATILPPPQSQSSEPLPAISELAKRQGDATRGTDVFFRPTIACANCHQVNGKGTDFGPNLSEIGSKYGKEALYDAILDPSVGIPFGYEAWQIELKNGAEAFGLIVSDTPEEVAVKAQTGIVTKYKKSDITQRERQKLSIMPAGLQATMTTSEFVDLVEYLASLKKAAN